MNGTKMKKKKFIEERFFFIERSPGMAIKAKGPSMKILSMIG
jgi:hypothetical protein